MLLGPDDKDQEKKNDEPKLFSAMNNDIDDNDNANDGDDLVESSFMVSFKANDPVNSVSEKLKEVEENTSSPEPVPAPAPAVSNNTDDFGFKDEFDDFEYDSSVSAFKPLASAVESAPVEKTPAPEAEPATAPAPAEEIAPAVKEEPKKQEPKIDAPVFDDDPDLIAFAGNAAKPASDPFKAGNDLDFAASSNASGSFAGTDNNGYVDDLELDEEALAISPFAPKAGNAVKPVPLAPAKKAPEDPKAETDKEVPEEDPSNLPTFGTVSSGVNAFAKKAAPEEPKNEIVKETPKTPEVEPAAEVAAEPVKEEAAAANRAAEVVTSAASKPAVSAETESPAAPETPKEEQAVSPFVPKGGAPAQPKPKPKQSAPIKRQRPGNPAAAPINPAFEQKGHPNAPVQPMRPAAASQAKPQPRPQPHKAPAAQAAHAQKTAIQPVNTVSKAARRAMNEKAKKEPGKGGIIALIVVLVVILGSFWALEKFGKLDIKSTKASQSSNTEASATDASSVEETTTTATSEETTTEATTEATTTEATTEATTEETTEATTEETTEATTEETTTEATTTTTAEATTTTTRSSGSSTPSLSYSITNPLTTSDGFQFDIAVTNNGSSDVNLSTQLNKFYITIDTADTITSLSSDYFTFTADPDNEGSFIGTPKSSSVIPGDEVTYVTIEGVTGDRAIHFQITNYYFDWNT